MTGAASPGHDAFAHRFEPAAPGHPMTVLALHGTGGDEHDLVGLASQLAPGAAVLSPRGPVDEGGMNRFFRRHAEGVFDVDDLRRRARQLVGWTRAACAAYERDPAGLVGVGFSNGANIASAALLADPTLLRGAVLLAPMVPYEPEEPVDLSGVAVLLGAGRADPIGPPAEVERLATLLADLGASVQVRWHDGGHQPHPDVLVAARDWLQHLAAVIGGDATTLP